MPFVIVSPAMPGPASHPRVAARAAEAGSGAGPSKRHSVRADGGAGAAAPITLFSLKRSVRRIASGTDRGSPVRLHDARTHTSTSHAPRPIMILLIARTQDSSAAAV